LFKSEFIEGFFVPLFPVVIRHLDVFVLLREWGGWGSNRNFCKLPFYSVHLKSRSGHLPIYSRNIKQIKK